MLRSLHVKLALVVSVGALILASVGSVLLYKQSYDASLRDSQRSLRQLLATVRVTAGIAAYVHNAELGKEVLDGLVINDIVLGAEIHDHSDFRVRSGKFDPTGPSTAIEQALANPIAAEELVGVLRVLPNQPLIEQRAGSVANAATVGLVVHTFLVAFLVVGVVYVMLTKALVGLSTGLHRMVPGEKERLSPNKLHLRDEFGRLIADINRLLDTAESKFAEERNLRARVDERTIELEAANRELEDSNQALVESQRALRSSGRRAELIYKALNDALVGEVLDDQYRIEARVGSGGFGTVYRAIQIHLGNTVALKVFKPVSGQDRQQAIERFRAEGVSTFRVQHANAIKVINFAIYLDAIVYLVMEFVEGVSLEDEIATQGRFAPARVVEVLAPVCDALAAAHAVGVVHRDVKPSNILLTRGGATEEVKLIDFGIAKILTGDGVDPLKNLTGTGLFIGTPSYMAPERFLASPYDGRSDVYAVGVIAYEMLAGGRPFEQTGEDSITLATRHIGEPPQALHQRGVTASRDFQDLVMRALAKDPILRPTAEEFGALLRAVDARGEMAGPNSGSPRENLSKRDSDPTLEQFTGGDSSAGRMTTPFPVPNARGVRS